LKKEKENDDASLSEILVVFMVAKTRKSAKSLANAPIEKASENNVKEFLSNLATVLRNRGTADEWEVCMCMTLIHEPHYLLC